MQDTDFCVFGMPCMAQSEYEAKLRAAAEKAKRLIDAGATPEEAGHACGLHTKEMAAFGLIEIPEKEYIIPVSYSVSGYIAVKAESAEAAMAKAEENLDRLPTMKNPVYVPDSYVVDGDVDEVTLLTELKETGRLKADVQTVDLTNAQ